jgi:hypothetical protein
MILMLALLITAAVCAADATVEIAPDQPVPHVYSDEPLILELRAAQDCAPDVHVLIEGATDVRISIALGTIPLRAGTRKWIALEQRPETRGTYNATITLSEGDSVQETVRAFCHIERPSAAAGSLVAADVTSPDHETFVALADMPVGAVRIAADHPDWEAMLEACQATGLPAAVTFAPAPMPAAAPAETEPPSGSSESEPAEDPNAPPPHTAPGEEVLAEAIAKTYGREVALWEIDSRAPETIGYLAAAIRRGGSRAPIIAAVHDPSDVETMLAHSEPALAGLAIRLPAPKPAELIAFRTAAEQSGLERMPLYCVGALLEDAEENPVAALRQLLTNRAAGARSSVFPAGLAYAPRAFGPAYVYLNGLAHRLADAQYVGPVDEGKQVTGHLFRKGATWFLVAWSTTEAELALPLGGAVDVVLTDAFNNPLALTREDETARVPVGAEPVYLSGVDGPLLQRAATAMAANEAAHLLQLLKAADTNLEPHTEIFTRVADGHADDVTRIDFIALLQGFAELEQRWQGGAISRADAVPVLAGLARLVRMLCILEQERSAEFVESLQNVIARCGEYQSVYLMSSGLPGRGGNAQQGSPKTTARTRGDWLLEEVNHLITEAETLRAIGRPIEAVGIASLAEARARALEFTL